MDITGNAFIDARVIHLFWGVQESAFSRQKREIGVYFHIVTISTKLICFPRKYKESSYEAECRVDQLIRQDCLEIHIALSHLNYHVRTLIQGYFAVIVSLSLLQSNVTWNKTQCALLIKEETEFLGGRCHRGPSLKRGVQYINQG